MEKRTFVISNFLWRFAERCGAQFVSFFVSIVLARLLLPSVYGSVALVSIAISILQVFVDSGLANALIQKKDADEIDFSTVFFANIFVCIFLYLILFFLSPFLSEFYYNEISTSVIRVLGLIIVISGVKNVQQAYVSRQMLFKKFFFATLSGTIISGVIGIVLAYSGFGVWALVFQTLTNLFFDTVILWCTVKWRPKFVFSLYRFKILLSYGWKLLATNLCEVIYSNIIQLFIGKRYTTSDLAFFNRGKNFPSLLINNIQMSIDSVMFPVLSKSQDNLDELKSIVRRTIKTSVYVVGSLLGGMFAIADNLIIVLLTDKWLPSIFYLRIFCGIWATCCLTFINMDSIMAIGRTDISLKMEITKKIIGFLTFIASIKFGIRAIAFSVLISDILGTVINVEVNGKLIKYPFYRQFFDILPELFCVVSMVFVVMALNVVRVNVLLKMIVQIIAGMIFFVVISIVTKNETFHYLINILLHRREVVKHES